jgi:hypothetical protein
VQSLIPFIHDPEFLALKGELESGHNAGVVALQAITDDPHLFLNIVGTLATADAIMKDVYRGPIIEQLNYKTWMLDMIERDSESVDFTGRRAIVPVEATGNESPSSTTDGGTLVDPQIDTEQDAIIAIRYHDGGLELTDALVRQATGNNAGAFVNKLDRSSRKLAASMRKNLNRQVFGDGTGLLATLASSPAASTTVTLTETQFLRTNMVVDVLNKSTGATTGGLGLTITAINRTTKVVTLSAAITATTTTDGLYKQGARNNESDGLRNITATGRTLHGINSATAGNEFWNGARRDAASAIAGEGFFELLADDVGQNGEGDVEVFLTTRGVRRRLADTYQSTKRFNDARAVEIHGGYTAIFVNEIPVIIDDDVPKGWAFALRKDAFLWVQLAEPDWLTDPRSTLIWHLGMGATLGKRRLAWQAWMVWYAALACVAPNRTGAIINAQDESN